MEVDEIETDVTLMVERWEVAGSTVSVSVVIGFPFGPVSVMVFTDLVVVLRGLVSVSVAVGFPLGPVSVVVCTVPGATQPVEWLGVGWQLPWLQINSSVTVSVWTI